MAEIRLRIEQQGKQSVVDRIRGIVRARRGEKPIQKKPAEMNRQAEKSSSVRPIEQVLVGAWNAVQPENQGKAILRVVDRWFTPKYKTDEERKRAAIIRPKLEKAVGWTAVGVEAGLIAFGVVKGYQKLRSVDWSRFGKRHRSAPAAIVVEPTGLTDLRQMTIPSRKSALHEQGRLADFRTFQMRTIIPDDRVPYMKEILPTIVGLAERVKQRHGLLKDDVASALARAQCGFLGVPKDMDAEAKLLAYLGEWIQFGSRPDDPGILRIRRLLPNPNTWAFPPVDAAVPLKAIEEFFVAFDRKNSYRADRADKVSAFSRWANIGFPALDDWLGLQGAQRVHDQQRMQELKDAWDKFGWMLDRK